MGTNVNTPKLQVHMPEFGHGARARVTRSRPCTRALHGTRGFRVSSV